MQAQNRIRTAVINASWVTVDEQLEEKTNLSVTLKFALVHRK